jgi:Ligand-gated ion channel
MASSLAILLSLLILSSITIFTTYAQESPSIFVDKFDTSQSYRTNVCERQRLVSNGSIAFSDALRGLNLTVVITDYQTGTVDDAFFSLKDGKIQALYPGLLAVILDEVASRAGFSWRNTFATVSPLDPINDVNKTWTDILLWGVEVFDISAEVWGKSAARMSKGVSFPMGWYDSSLVLVENFRPGQSREVVNLWGFLNPFDYTVWLSICGFIVLTGLTYWLLEYLDVNTDESHVLENPIGNIYRAATTTTGHFGFEPSTHSARILGFSWTFWALIVGAAYTANMASFLVSPKMSFYRINSFQDAIDTKAAVCVKGGDVVDSLMTELQPNVNLVRKNSNEDAFLALRVNPTLGGCDTAVFELNSLLLYEKNKEVNFDCTLASEKQVQLHVPSGMATAIDTGLFRCTSLISHVLDYYLAEMMSDGFVEEVWRKHLNRIATIECVVEPQRGASSMGFDETFSLTLEDVGGIFVLHVILSGLSVAIAIYQFFFSKDGKAKKRSFLQVFGIQQLQTEVVRRRESFMVGFSSSRRNLSADFKMDDSESVFG